LAQWEQQVQLEQLVRKAILALLAPLVRKEILEQLEQPDPQELLDPRELQGQPGPKVIRVK
jgi:hypothetical protein